MMMNKAKYQDFSDNHPKYHYYETYTSTGIPVYYTYEFKPADEYHNDVVDIATYKLEVEYETVLWFWTRKVKHTYTKLVSVRKTVKEEEDPFDVFVPALKKLVEESEKFVNTLDKKLILTNKLRTFDGRLYEDQKRTHKIDNLLKN